MSQGQEKILTESPLDDVLEGFYKPRRDRSWRARRDPAQPKPTHYKIVCISLYTKDLDRLDELVKELKSRGHTRANRSQLIRAALDQVDLDKVPKTY